MSKRQIEIIQQDGRFDVLFHDLEGGPLGEANLLSTNGGSINLTQWAAVFGQELKRVLRQYGIPDEDAAKAYLDVVSGYEQGRNTSIIFDVS